MDGGRITHWRGPGEDFSPGPYFRSLKIFESHSMKININVRIKMNNFKTGDKVKVVKKPVIRPLSIWTKKMDGLIGCIGEVQYADIYDTSLSFFDSLTDIYWFPNEILQKVEEKADPPYLMGHKKSGLKIGDEVEILPPEFCEEELTWDNKWASPMSDSIGRKGIIVRDNGSMGFAVKMKESDSNLNSYCFPYYSLKKVKKAKEKRGIVIETEKVVERGQQKFKLLSITALSKDELPVKYTTKPPYCHKIGEWLYIVINTGMFYLKQGGIYLKKDIYEKLLIIEECSERLREINKEIAEKNKHWTGKHKFVI
jgi:hypothetical protein